MKEAYIDIMEKALSAYSTERIVDYINEVKRDGLKEHGFPRLTANIGILISFGRRTELKELFCEMMDICCENMPRVKAANDFSIREICSLLQRLSKIDLIGEEKLSAWKRQLAAFDPWHFYTCVAETPETPVGNWAAYAALSDWMRGLCCGEDTLKFVEWEVASQLLSFDTMGMYKDPDNPMVYDGITRLLLGALIQFGYNGKHRQAIEQQLLLSADITLQMQSVTGEIPFGGRSNQFLHNEAYFAALFECYACLFAEKKQIARAAQYKAAARLAQKVVLQYLSLKPISHIKNRYPIDSLIGCEDYGYFNKYMITVASFAWLAYTLCDDDIPQSEARAQTGGYAVSTGADFHKIFLNCGGYFAEFDTAADFHYDANGLGRIHKQGCPSALCLSVPFPAGEIDYKLESENPRGMSLCCYVERNGETVFGAQKDTVYRLVRHSVSDGVLSVGIDCLLPNGAAIGEQYILSESGVEMKLLGSEDCGFMLPAFVFDGSEETGLSVRDGCISVEYKGFVCEYRFYGEILGSETYYNRNGRYQVFKVRTKSVTVTMQ